ncbi:MAG: isoleucine--tRNA ligase [Candidatus Altiarchaeota archaeon]
MSYVDLPKLEEEVQKYWNSQKIFEEVCNSRKGKKKFYFLQGPPFTSGKAHIGHAWNHALKDFVLRYKTMQGYDVFRRAGWDMHGLPIEVKVEEEVLKSKSKKDIEKFGIENFVSECKKFAIRNMQSMTSQLKRLGAWLDWDNPYMTLNRDYIESVWFGIKKAHEKNLLYEDIQVIHWCPRCETALAGYEAKDQYEEIEDFSIYVKVQLKGKEEKILIWTTTPWTLPANVAIALHPEFTYVRVKFKGEILILVKEMLEKALGKDAEYEILSEMSGQELDGLQYVQILDIPIQKGVDHRIVMAPNLVNLEEGTGCVHIAPGHGEEDFEVGKIYNLQVLSPVDEQGRLTAEPYKGINIRDANTLIIEDLKKKGTLLKEEKIYHRYPHCWRCKSPLILRTTKQWFLRVSRLVDSLIEKNKEISWVPKHIGSGRFENWLMNAKDWCISRQRYWNTPLPIWRCECGKTEVIGSIKELSEKSIEKIDIENLDLHRPSIDKVKLRCPSCNKEMFRVKDVLDVWIDSGSASWACLAYPKEKKLFEELFPADFITEGSDQTRGWFYSLLVSSVIAFDRVPYKRVLYHGFTLDAEGRKMSKSLGNVIDPDEIIKEYGADILRFYTLWATVPWEDLKFSLKGVATIEKIFNILLNSFEFAIRYMELDKFEFSSSYKPKLEVEDRWILSRFNSLIEKVTDSMENLYPHEVTRELANFIVFELSRIYIKLIRERVWTEKNKETKIAAYHTLYEIFTGLSKLLAPIAPHISEFIYREMTNEKSVHLTNWPVSKKEEIDKELENEMETAKEIMEAVKSARQKAKIKLRWPIARIVLSLKKDSKIKNVKGIILRSCNAKRIEEKTLEEEVVAKPNFSFIGPKFKDKSKLIAEELKKLDGKKIKKEIETKGKVKILNFTLEKNDLIFETKMPSDLIAEEFSKGVVYIDSKISDELYSEAMAREVIRRVQEMRKELNLNELQRVDISIECDNEFTKFIGENKSFIERETRTLITEKKFDGFSKNWKIEGKDLRITIKI